MVNLSGFDGVIEVERGQGLSYKNSKILNLTVNDFVNIFCIGCIMFKSIAENYKKIINFSDWDQIIGGSWIQNLLAMRNAFITP